MSWPEKHTRKVNVMGKQFLWHLSKNRIDSKEQTIAVGMEKKRHFLFIDPYPWNFEITPSNISKAVYWALNRGWDPENGPTRNMAYSDTDQDFVWLPKGVQFIHTLDKK